MREQRQNKFFRSVRLHAGSVSRSDTDVSAHCLLMCLTIVNTTFLPQFLYRFSIVPLKSLKTSVRELKMFLTFRGEGSKPRTPRHPQRTTRWRTHQKAVTVHCTTEGWHSGCWTGSKARNETGHWCYRYNSRWYLKNTSQAPLQQALKTDFIHECQHSSPNPHEWNVMVICEWEKKLIMTTIE